MNFPEYFKLVSLEAEKINPDIKLSERDIRECFNLNMYIFYNETFICADS